MSLLEGLPPELRYLLLRTIPDLATLRSLVRASPVLYAQYSANRPAVLRACLGREMDGFFIDAYATAMSRACELGSTRTNDSIIQFLNTYRGWVSRDTPRSRRVDIESIPPDCVCWLRSFHISVARPWANLYVRWALASLRYKATGTKASAEIDEGEIQLSRSEEVRIFRAIYRHETYHHLFGLIDGLRDGAFDAPQVNGLFFCIFEPWESEAVGCINTFAKLSCTHVFDPVKKKIKKRIVRIVGPRGGMWRAEHEIRRYVNGTIARGLKKSLWLLRLDDHAVLLSEMKGNIPLHPLWDTGIKDTALCNALRAEAQRLRRILPDHAGDPRDAAEGRRDPIEFTGDTVSPEVDPPIAWVLLWNGKYSHLYGDHVPFTLRLWGYVMWDERRWTDMGARDLVAKQWETDRDLVGEIKNLYNWSPTET